MFPFSHHHSLTILYCACCRPLPIQLQLVPHSILAFYARPLSAFNPTYWIVQLGFEVHFARPSDHCVQPNCNTHPSRIPLWLPSLLAYPIPHGIADMRGTTFLRRITATPGLPCPQHSETECCACYSATSNSLRQRNATDDVCLLWTMVLFRSVSHVQRIETVADSFEIVEMQIFTAGGACA